MNGDEATKKELLTLDAVVACPDCMSNAVIYASRKSSKARVECEECGVIDHGVIEYGGGLEIGGFDQ